MKVTKIEVRQSTKPTTCVDCYIDNGYVQGESGSLPDVDVDYESTRRQEVKEYIERRYNHDGLQRVFSAGTLTTLQLKAVIKDVCRVHRVPISYTNYMTAILSDDLSSWTDLMKFAAVNKKIRSFVHTYPKVFEDIRTLMGQPRSSSIHASALLVTPDHKDGKTMECFDFTPIKKVDGVLVSELDGYSLDAQGLLKNDCLGIKELSKLHQVIDLVNENYHAGIDFQGIVQSGLDDDKVFQMLRAGHTKNIFQMSSAGMTKLLKSIKVNSIDDLIAANALFRPATLASGSAQRYADIKNGAPVTYLWGTFDSLKSTYGQLTYQEQLVTIAREVGGFSLAEGVKLVKFISKKKVDKILKLESKFMAGAKKKGCPEEDAKAIWELFQNAGTYLFNKSHATAYGVTAYVGAWLKVYYPTAFYTVALEYAKDDEVTELMSEMSAWSNAKVVAPSINHSGVIFFSDYDKDEIYWALSKISYVGAKTVEYIVQERDVRGPFTSLENFIFRIFKYKLVKYEYWDNPQNPDEAAQIPVNARHVRNLILAGCFDEVENITDLTKRYDLLEQAANILGFKLNDREFPEQLRDKHYFWAQRQIDVSALGDIDYKRIYTTSSLCTSYNRLQYKYKEILEIREPELDGTNCTICATIVGMDEHNYVGQRDGLKKTFCKLTLMQGTNTIQMILWDGVYKEYYETLKDAKNKIICATCKVQYSSFSNANELASVKTTKLIII